SDFALARYDPDGSLDTSFDGDGKLTTPFADGHDIAFAVGVDSQGRLVAAGWAIGGLGTTALARYRPNGSLDATFRGDGKVTAGGGLLASTMAFDAQDRIVVAGGTVSSDTSGVARFIGDAVPPAAPAIDSGPGNGSFTNDPKPTFKFSSEAGATFACGFDG